MQRSVWVATGALVFCVTLWLGISMNFTASHNRVQEAMNREYHVKVLTHRIMHLDEVLTMSARMGAATGDPKWKKRYDKFEPELDKVIGENRSRGSGLA